MSLSPLVSFKSRFVTYLLNFPRILLLGFMSTRHELLQCHCTAHFKGVKRNADKSRGNHKNHEDNSSTFACPVATEC